MSGVHSLVCVHPDQLQQLLACIFTSCIGTISWTPSESTHSISSRLEVRSSGRYPPLTSSPPSSQKLVILNKDFWCWACNLFNCTQRVILFELLTKCLQHRCYQFWRVRVQQRSLHLGIHQFISQILRILFKEALQGCFDFPPTAGEEFQLFNKQIHLILIASSECSICTGPRTKYVVAPLFKKKPYRGFSPRCMPFWMFIQPITISQMRSHVALHHHMKTFTK